MTRPFDKNRGKHPLDPEYHDDFDYDKEVRDYELLRELEQDDERFNQTQ